MSVLFLTVFMQRGFGVAVVIDRLAAELSKHGIKVVVGCLEHDDTIPELEIVTLEPNPDSIAATAKRLGDPIIVAHATPFFEVLPTLADQYRCWAWEHGDPSPEFFASDRAARQSIIVDKVNHIYPHLERVIAISEFVRSEIAYPDATIINNGCDHMPDLGEKPPRPSSKQLSVGTLMRLGNGEALYKGKQIVLQLQRLFSVAGVDVEFRLMGRGSDEDARDYKEQGFKVHLNATDEDKATFLHELDVLVSPSLWEGCNLPLLEAQALGTAALAFDTGAHPETTPLVCRHLGDMVSLITQYSNQPELLAKHSALCYRFVRGRFSWQRAGQQMLALMQ